MILSADSSAASDRKWVAVATLLRPQGRRGELLAEPLTDLPEVFKPGQAMRLAATAASLDLAPLITLEDSWHPQGRNAGRLVLKLAGTDSISAAEALQGRSLFLPEDALPALEPGTFLVRDLVGCTLIDGSESLGTVIDLQFPIGPDGHTRLHDAADLLVVQRRSLPSEADPVLVPFVQAWLVSVDLDAREIRMQLPSGLLVEDEADGLAPGSELASGV